MPARKNTSGTKAEMHVFREIQSVPTVLQLSTAPTDFSGKSQGYNTSNEGERHSALQTLIYRARSVQCDDEVNNFRLPPLTTYASHPVSATAEETITTKKSFCSYPTSNTSSTKGRSTARTCNCLPNAGILWKHCYSATFIHLATQSHPHTSDYSDNYRKRKAQNFSMKFYLLLQGIKHENV